MRTFDVRGQRLAFIRFWMPLAVVCGVLSYAADHIGASVVAQTVRSETQAGDGRSLFYTYCASCHGASGAGNGPVAASMRKAPPDLTGLALANGGVFPTDRMRRVIDGRLIEAHGDRDMPVWGDAFKAIRGGHSEQSVRERIESVLQYLISMQRRLA